MAKGGQSGLGHGARFRAVSTNDTVAPERFEFWKSHFAGVEMAPLSVRDVDYRATAHACVGDDGIVFTELSCDPTGARYGGGELGHMRMSVLTRGRIEVTHGHDGRDVARPGAGIQLLDCLRPSQADSPTGYEAYYIAVPRALVVQTMGGEPVGAGEALRTLGETPLSLMLKAQLRALARYGPLMDAAEAEAAMQSLSGLTLAYLHSFRARPGEDGALDDAMFNAACSYIDGSKETQNLSAGAVARAIGCSRARLYRIFERRGLAVSEEIRRVRLNHSRALLRDPTLDIGDVALRCGYSDLSAFGKAFRRRFGVSAREWRSEMLQPKERA